MEKNYEFPDVSSNVSKSSGIDLTVILWELRLKKEQSFFFAPLQLGASFASTSLFRHIMLYKDWQTYICTYLHISISNCKKATLCLVAVDYKPQEFWIILFYSANQEKTWSCFYIISFDTFCFIWLRHTITKLNALLCQMHKYLVNA